MIKEVIKNTISSLIQDDNKVSVNQWQAQKKSFEMYEINNVFIKMDLVSSLEILGEQTMADLPWSENHFLERIGGATNPGEQYKFWPYYQLSRDNEVFRKTGKFSHTYQERFWPPLKKGIRFKMGNYNDIKQRLKNDYTTRQAFLSIWHPEDQSNNNERLPCTIGYWFNIKNNKLNITYLIRSCDAVRHFRNDIYMTQRLAIDMLNNLDDVNISLGEMSMWIGSFHCFTSDKYFLMKKILNK